MAVDAFEVLYAQETEQVFMRSQSLLSDRVWTQGMPKGYQFVFDLFGDRTRTAVTRGATGDIPYQQTDQSQVTLTMEQWFAPLAKNQFNVVTSQGNQRRAMQEECVAVINRTKDQQIIDALVTGTLVSAAAGTMTVDYALKAMVNLMNTDAGNGMLTGLITPAAWAYLVQQEQVSSKDYVDTSKILGPGSKMFDWNGARWLVHTGLPGIPTASATCLIFNQKAIGYGMNSAETKHEAGYNAEQARSWALSTLIGGAKLLQNTGVIKLLHDDTGFTL